MSDERPERTCPRCGQASRTRFEQCPDCGASYFAKPSRFPRRNKLVAAAVALALLAAGSAVAVPAIRESKRDSDARAKRAQAKLVARERARLARVQAPRRGRSRGLASPSAGAPPARQVAARRALVSAMEGAIARDARARVARGELKGEIRSATCGPLSPNSGIRDEQDDLRRPLGRYGCVATMRPVISDGKVVARYGYDYVGTADFRRFAWVICLNHPPPSENGVPLAQVRLAPECLGLAKDAKVVANGYADPDAGP